MLAEGVDAAYAGEFRGVVELGHVGWVACEEGFFEELDDGALEGYDLALELGLGDHWSGWWVSVCRIGGSGRGLLTVSLGESRPHGSVLSVEFPLDHRTALLQGTSQVIVSDPLRLSVPLPSRILSITPALLLLNTTFQIFYALVLAFVKLFLVSVPALLVNAIKQVDPSYEGTSDG